jgi:hypothetical protein
MIGFPSVPSGLIYGLLVMNDSQPAMRLDAQTNPQTNPQTSVCF